MNSSNEVLPRRLILQITNDNDFNCSLFTQENAQPYPAKSSFVLELQELKNQKELNNQNAIIRSTFASLPQNHQLFYYFQEFHELYERLAGTLICTTQENPPEIIQSQDLIREQLRVLRPLLIKQLNDWLNYNHGFMPIRDRINQLSFGDLLIIKTQNIWLQKIPWHEWNLLKLHQNRRVEVMISHSNVNCDENPTNPINASSTSTNTRKANILIIIGKYIDRTFENGEVVSERIIGYSDIAQNLSNQIINNNCNISYLTTQNNLNINNCQRIENAQQVFDHIRSESWDILILFGHMQTEQNDCGYFKLNDNVSLTIHDLERSITEATNNSNSSKLLICLGCSSLGFANNLNSSQINLEILTHCIVIKYRIRPQEAFILLSNLLEGFIETGYLHRGMLRARIQLRESEPDGISCVSFLPLINCFQPYINSVLTWQNLITETIEPPPPVNILLTSIFGYNIALVFVKCLEISGKLTVSLFGISLIVILLFNWFYYRVNYNSNLNNNNSIYILLFMTTLITAIVAKPYVFSQMLITIFCGLAGAIFFILITFLSNRLEQ